LLAGCALPSPDDLPARQRASPGAPLVEGNEARLLVDGPSTHAAMFGAMAQARDHINLQTYILEDGEAGERLVAVLKDKAAAGVQVHVLYDSIGSIGTPREYFDRLREAGVRVCEFNPVKTRIDRVNSRRVTSVTSGGSSISSDAMPSVSTRSPKNKIFTIGSPL